MGMEGDYRYDEKHNMLTEDQRTEIRRIASDNYKDMWGHVQIANLYQITVAEVESIINDAPAEAVAQTDREEVVMAKDTPKDAPAEKPAEPKKPSYLDKIRTFMKDNKGVAQADALADFVGSDRKNLSVSVSILRNPARTKEPMAITYVRSLQTFFCTDIPAGKAAMDKALKVAADAAAKEKADKAAAKKAAADKKAADKKAADEKAAAEKKAADAKAKDDK